jgi:hypothetical protein
MLKEMVLMLEGLVIARLGSRMLSLKLLDLGLLVYVGLLVTRIL